MAGLLTRAGALLLVLLIGAVPARAEWRRAESPHFVLYGAVSERELRERILQLEDFDRLLRVVTSVNDAPSPNRLHVYIVDGNRQLNAIRTVPPQVAGFYIASAEGIAAFASGAWQGPDAESHILFHEYAHHFMWQHRPNAYPAWYVEGFAEYFMTARFRSNGIEIGNASPGRAFEVMQGSWLPMDRLLFTANRQLRNNERSSFYALSWLLTHYFYSNDERRAQLVRYLGEARRTDPRSALQQATGLNSETLAAALRRYIANRRITISRIPLLPAREVPVTVTVLSRAADAMMLDAAALRVGVGPEFREAMLSRVRAAAARYPDDPFAMRTLAHAEAVYGDGAAAERLLERLLAGSPNDAELLYLMGRRWFAAMQGDNPPEQAARNARTWFGRAHSADGNHFQTLYRYAGTFRGDPRFVSENTNNILQLAQQLAPQVNDVRMAAAQLAIERRDMPTAIRLLEPLAADPHNERLAEAAGRLLARARGEPEAQGDGAAQPRTSGQR